MRSRKAANADRQFRSVPEVAEMLGVGTNKVLAWIRTGDIVATDLSQVRGDRPRWYIAMAEVERFVTVRQSVPANAKAKPRRKPRRDIVEFVK